MPNTVGTLSPDSADIQIFKSDCLQDGGRELFFQLSMTDLHDVLERALEKDRTMQIQKEPESAEFDTEGIADPAEVIVDLDSDSDDGEDVNKDIYNGDGEVVG